MRINDELKQMLDENIVYPATSTEEGKPNSPFESLAITL
jgi:hypothetical protein